MRPCTESGCGGHEQQEHWNRGFESHSRHGGVAAFFCIVLTCVRGDHAIGRHPVQVVLPKVYEGISKSFRAESITKYTTTTKHSLRLNTKAYGNKTH
jgi:hypothetical protein